jgi:hypothetical protein
MKKHIKVMLAAGFTAAMAVTTAFSQTNVLTVDEFGVGTYNGTPLASGPLFDPSSGITTIGYTLPFPAVPGDVVLSEPNIGTVSDVLRFDGNGNLFFFSDFDLSDPPDAPADKGLPSTYQLNTVFFTESGVEGGLQGLFGYAPGSGDPGDNSAGAIYNFISDVPEPGALPLLACGLGMLGYVQHRRKLARG